jgi:hypothetical protein
MKNLKKHSNLLLAMMAAVILMSSCKKDSDEIDPMVTAPATYSQEDQMGRPAINTVFVASEDKDIFNLTKPSSLGLAFSSKFNSNLLALNAGYTTNLLGLDSPSFTSLLASDVLTVATSGPTTFYDGTNVLTGRTLADDVITVELILIFGGPDATENPTLTDDHVDGNDKVFLTSFPYLATPH